MGFDIGGSVLSSSMLTPEGGLIKKSFDSTGLILYLDAAKFLGGNLTRDFWKWNDLAGHTVATITDGMEGNTVLRMSVQAFPTDNIFIKISTAKTYRTSFWARAATGTNGILYFDLWQWQDIGVTTCTTNGGRSPYKPSAQAAHTDWRYYTYTWGSADWQANVQYVKPDILGSYGGTTGYWEVQGLKFEEVTPWNDLSGLGNNAALTIPSFSTTGGGSMLFNGTTGSSADVTANLGTLSAYTFSSWNLRTIDSRMSLSSETGSTFYWYGDNSWRFVHGGVAAEFYYAKTVSIPAGTWGFFCVTYDGTNIKIYRNAVLEDTLGGTSGTAVFTSGLKIGNWNGSGGYEFTGYISIVQAYNKAQTAAQVLQNFNAFRTRYNL